MGENECRSTFIVFSNPKSDYIEIEEVDLRPGHIGESLQIFDVSRDLYFRENENLFLSVLSNIE